jgi:hypothetical protein
MGSGGTPSGIAFRFIGEPNQYMTRLIYEPIRMLTGKLSFSTVIDIDLSRSLLVSADISLQSLSKASRFPDKFVGVPGAVEPRAFFLLFRG